MLRLASWNVRGLKDGFAPWLAETVPDVLCLQAMAGQPMAVRYPPGYQAQYAASVGVLSRVAPDSVQSGLGVAHFDTEGRALTAHYEAFSVVNVHVPGGSGGRAAWFYKMAFLYHLLDYVLALRAEDHPVVLCGDFRIAHQPIDVARPLRIAGFTAEERDWISEVLEAGFIDSFRHLHPRREGVYSWWPERPGARQANRGWRVDYIFLSAELAPRLRAADVDMIEAADHSPVWAELE